MNWILSSFYINLIQISLKFKVAELIYVTTKLTLKYCPDNESGTLVMSVIIFLELR